MAVVRASTKYQVAIPKRVRVRYGIKPGQRFSMTEREDGILLTPMPEDPIEYLCGIFENGPSLTDELLKERARDLEHE